jgi:uncharacterized membrane protein YraQ (UPF0718 family)
VETGIIQQFISVFSGIFYEAMPWVVLGSVLAALVQELPTRWAPTIMVPVGLSILFLTVSPLSTPAENFFRDRGLIASPLAFLAVNLLSALVLALVAGFLLWMIQPVTTSLLHYFSRHRGAAIGASGLLGLVLPMCDCGILAVMRRLFRKGMPLSCCTAYVLAGPILNFVVLSTVVIAFGSQDRITKNQITGQPQYNFTGMEMMWLRAGLGYLVAVGTAFIVEWMYRRHGTKLLAPGVLPPNRPKTKEEVEDEALADDEPPKTVWKRVNNVAEAALHDIVDIGVYLTLGALLASGIRIGIEALPAGAFIQNNAFVAIAFMMGLAFLITLCSEADAFVAYSFQSIGSAPKLAFLVLGPMLDIKLFLMYLRVFRPRLLWTIILAIVVQVYLYSVVTHVAWENLAPKWFNPSAATAPSK